MWREFGRDVLAKLDPAGTLPITNEEWQAFTLAQADLVLPYVQAGVASGVQQGAQQVGLAPSKNASAVRIDWQLVNRNAVTWAQDYTYALVDGITATTRARLSEALTGWLAAGEAFPDLRQRVAQIFDDPRRAELIAVTETTRAIAEGNTRAWEAAQVWGREWRTARDELVCPVCGPLHQQRAQLGQAFPGNIGNPPAHPNCRCIIVPVVAPERSPLEQRPAPGVGHKPGGLLGR